MAWIIIAAVILLLILILQIPVCIRIAYHEQKMSVNLKIWPVTRQLVSQDEQDKEEAAPAKPKKKTEKPAAAAKHRRINREQIMYLLEKAPPILGRAVRRLGRRIRINPLTVYLLIASPDPADTAELYGKITACLGALLPTVHRYMHIKNQDIQLFPDFTAEEMDVILDIGISLRLWDGLVILFCAGGSALKVFLGFRKLGQSTEEAQKPSNRSAQADA